MRYSNLHTHTTFSDGAHSVEENILSALDKNMLSLGFSDHSYTPCDPSYCMLPDRYPGYLRTLREMKEKYADRLPIFAGLELDYYSELNRADYDYIIASVHYLVYNGKTYMMDHAKDLQLDCIREIFGGDRLAFARAYFDTVVRHVLGCRPTLVGHFDVITKFGLMPEEDPRYQEIARDALKKILPVCPYVEMNTGAITRGFRQVPYPSPYLLDPLRELGGEIVLCSDSHNRDHLINHFDRAVELLKSHGFDHISRFTGTGFVQDKI